MKKKRMIPLVIFIFSALLIMGSVKLFIFKTREIEKTESTNGITETNIDNVSKLEESKEEVENQDDSIAENKEDDISTTNNTQNNVINEKVEESKSNNKTAKEETTNNTDDSQTSNIKQEIKKEETTKEEQSQQSTSDNNTNNQNNQKVYEIPAEDSREKNNGSTDPEYLKIKASCEFTTRSECQAALTDIQIKYLSSEHPMVSASCESYAYKGEIVGYRVLLTYGDGNYFYNN